jgi:5-methyltetrahydropteroyltriglutamate--homocysteine methyltransferase
MPFAQTNIIFDDIGSYPLPKDINKNWIADALKKGDQKSFDIVKDAMRQKIYAGVDVPTYPQFQDMTKQFLEIINDESMTEEPMLVRKENARIKELEVLEDIGTEYSKKTGDVLDIRICITGPIELYNKQFGGTSYKDVLDVLATNIDRFIANSIDNAKKFRITTVSIDEPSIGINPQIMFSDDDIVDVLEKASKTAVYHKIDTELHLHSPLHYKLVCKTRSIGIIGVESAANPSYLDLIDKKDLEEYDKFLRVGIARTDIFNMTAILNEKYGTNIWKEPFRLEEIVTRMETSNIIEKRLESYYKIFDDRIKYAGPDCGLGAWPTQELAFSLLKNTSIGIKEFLKKMKR